MRRDAFTTFHPVVNFVYFTFVLVLSMAFMHPIFQAISLASAIGYSILLNGRKAVKFNLLYMLPLLLVMAAFNPIFNHAGVTILFYLPNGNPFTKESILYGIAAACMYVTVIVWFSCFNKVITSDKLMYIFGKIMPAISLILAMTLRFVPRYRHQLSVISQAQRSIGRDLSQGNLIERARNGLRILSILTTWAMENAIETADSMKARGYGLPKRTSFSIYRFERRDQLTLAIMTGLVAVVLTGGALGENTIRYFPSVVMKEYSPLSFVVYGAYFIFCTLPVMFQIVEEVKWKYIVSKI
ncbi:energy-coupling factor transport system permease protein [Paenibacillaceae bacterium GAS479]|nr:energy-coupling factor transport system permease protein [Paenibacillaceae bacterium GAS479]